MPIIIPPTTPLHYATPDLILQSFGKSLYTYVYDIDNTGSLIDTRVEWSLCRADELINTKLFPSRYVVPLMSSDGNPIMNIPDWAAQIAFIRAFMLRGGELEKGQQSRYRKVMACVRRDLGKVVSGLIELNAVYRTNSQNGPLAC